MRKAAPTVLAATAVLTAMLAAACTPPLSRQAEVKYYDYAGHRLPGNILDEALRLDDQAPVR